MTTSRPEFLQGISPHHGEVVRNVFSKATQDKLAAKLGAMPNGETWYADIYNKAIYGPMVFRDKELNIASTIERLLPEYRILADLYLEKTPSDSGFPFHTDFDSVGFMEHPEDMLTVWVPLTPVKEAGSGQLSIVMEEGAVRLSLIREAYQLHSLLRVTDPSIPEHPPFQMTVQEHDYMERTKFTPSLDAGDALLFCNAFFHKSEDVLQGKRAAYIMRLVPKDARFNRTRLLGLRKLGQNLAVVNELLEQYYPDAL
jgi:ectoine hydroxylase-related dioxygenase (phytanoyl-CoA dioxygenase family)